MEKISPSPVKESPKSNKKPIQVKTVEIEKERINTDCSNELSPTLNHVSNIMSPHTVFQGSLNFLQSDVSFHFDSYFLKVFKQISTLQENPTKKISEEQFIKKNTTLEFGKTICSLEFPAYVTSNLIKGLFISVVMEKLDLKI